MTFWLGFDVRLLSDSLSVFHDPKTWLQERVKPETYLGVIIHVYYAQVYATMSLEGKNKILARMIFHVVAPTCSY